MCGHGAEGRELVQAARAGAGRRRTAGQAQRAVELAETLGCITSWVGYCATQLYSCTGSPIDGRLRLGPVCARCVAWGARLHRAFAAYHVMLRVMTGMRQWWLRRLPPRDARERSREPGRVLAGGRGVVLGMSSQRESAGASQRYLLAEPNWLECARNSVCVRSARRPRGHMISTRYPV